ncbi:zinc finger CCCH domain-containing protein 58-like [Silene latifolia]|uniref:zinc finger CCCH domain-containing protein 58-like n=1 Tax=Silene latifolia TaxID=37657 RepID=UPI003D76D09F
MELYGRNQGSEIDHPATQWGETGLEESMWRLGISGQEAYPERPGVSDCVYYMRTGSCGFGSRCRYNHPRDRAAVVVASRLVGGEYPERPGELSCQYYLKTGTCKFGATCKFNHPRNAGGSLTDAPLNYHGLPLRPGEKECSYYLSTGQCKFGRTCKFHHPQPAGMPMPAAAPPFYPTVQPPSLPITEQASGSSTSYRATRPPLVPGSFVPGSYGPMLLSPGVVPMPGWGSYSGSVQPALSPGAQTAGASVYGVTPRHALPGSYPNLPTSIGQSASSVKEFSFPERPGEPECQYYLKTGSCKFGASCRFHHPPDRAAACFLGPLGLPLRPGTQPCTFYMQNGYCKFGTTCKFDHPVGMMNYSPSASSLAEMPISPYLGGSMSAILPSPSPSSMSLRPEYSIPSQSGNGSIGSTSTLTSSISDHRTGGQSTVLLASGH